MKSGKKHVSGNGFQAIIVYHPHPYRFLCVAKLRKSADYHKPAGQSRLQRLFHKTKPVQFRHTYIDKNDIRRIRYGLVKGFHRILELSCNAKPHLLPISYFFQIDKRPRLIIHQKNAVPLHFPTLFFLFPPLTALFTTVMLLLSLSLIFPFHNSIPS